MTTRVRMGKPEPVTRAEALVAEEQFFERLRARLNGMQGVFHPLDGRMYDASARHRNGRTVEDRAGELKGAVKRLAERDLMRIYEEMPKGTIEMADITHKELLGPKSVKVVVAGASFSPTEDLIREGRSSRSIGADELARVRDRIVTRPHAFHYVGAFATTTWDPGCRAVITGPNYLVALVDRVEGAWRTYYSPDTRWRGGARLFDLTSEEEKVEAVRRLVRRRPFALLMDEMTEDYVFDELGYPIPIIREAFERVAAEDRFVRFDTGTRPFRLIRTYG
ncbi:MAG TPA: hypothetical protein VFC90_01845 [Planctomycetota bacterium]|nr:hypothetical protein [Planctomycetota bacterium]